MLENMNNIVNDILFIQKMDLSHIISKEYPIQIQHAMYFGAYWLYYYVFIHLLYYVGGLVMITMFKTFYPKAGTLKISRELIIEQIKLSEVAFPLYCAIPALTMLFVRLGISKLRDSIEDTGGYTKSILYFSIYLFLVEGMIYYVHYWLLHKWKWGKDHLKHDLHHSYKHESEMATWSGYAFEAIDGALQGLPLVIGTLIIPIPTVFYALSGAFIGMWTMYIHTGTSVKLPWPLMGSDYHLIHHVYNWYNFGLYTMFWDWLFGTLKHPSSKVDHFIQQTKENPKSLEELHTMFHSDDVFNSKNMKRKKK